MKKTSVLILFVLLGTIQVHGQKFKGLALTPPMGWNSWNNFGCDVTEGLIMSTADAMVENGMKDAGYKYIVIDDCWHGERDSLGFIHPNAERFPSGMKALADYVHSKGLKLGIYSDAGWKTCGGHPGSRGYEYQDALTYAKWGVDYLKYDWCNTQGLKAEGAYLTMRDALHKAGRPIVFSICEWGDNEPWKWAQDIGHLWRTTGDIAPIFDGEHGHGNWTSWGVLQIIDMRKNIRTAAGPDHWNDPDMMEVGNGMSVAEDRSHFSMWCMLAAPLMAGNDIRNMSKETQTILTNKEAVAVNQDSLGIQGFKYLVLNDVDVWVKALQGGDMAICLLNRSTSPQKVAVKWEEFTLEEPMVNPKLFVDFKKEEYNIRDLWAHKDIGTTGNILKATVGAHDVMMLRLSK